jgi:Zn-dependent peptidase ImmA (M78 family)
MELRTQSTVEKGDRLEKEVYEIFKKLLENDKFYLSPKTSKIFYKKGYYSKDRQKNIVFDISIETYVNGAEDYSMLTLIECKNLNKKVPVDDVEEFCGKITQIGEHNTKGIIITSVGFQESAFNVGKSKKVGLARIKNSDSIEWLSYRKDRNIKIDEKEFLSSNLTDTAFISHYGGKMLDGIPELLVKMAVIDVFIGGDDIVSVPYVSMDRINYIVKKLYDYKVYDGLVLDFNKLNSLMTDSYGVDFLFDVEEATPFLGKIEFNPLKIKISKKARESEHVWRFTLAHEIGHLILHSKIIGGRIVEKTDGIESLSLKYYNSNRDVSRMEFQANLFASTLLIPDDMLLRKMARLFVVHDVPRCKLFLDEQPVNRRIVYSILNELSDSFKVSIETVKIKLIKLDLLVDTTDYRLSTIIRKMMKS